MNAAVDRAHREGLLRAASLMVAGGAAADAVRVAKANPGLRVGLHLVLVEGPAVLDQPISPGRTFVGDQARAGLRYFALPSARRQLRAEIRAQFEAFAATGLTLDHANAHKHMHLHPTVGRMMIEEGRRFGLSAIRIPREPGAVLRRLGERPGLGADMLERWTGLLSAQARRAGLATNDAVFGIAWSGRMTRERVTRLAGVLPPGRSEIYFHPATETDPTLARTMPGYDHPGELACLLDPAVRAAFEENGVSLE